MGKKIAICIFLMIVLYLLVSSVAAQTDVLRVSPKESTVLDKNTLEKWTLEEFERDNVKLLAGHEIEVNLILRREVSDIPDSYYLELRTDMYNPDWDYDGTHYKGSPVTVWNSTFEHARSSVRIILTAKVPDSLIVSDVEEPHFEERVTGIGEKNHYIELTLYNRGTFVETVKRTEFFATSPELIDMQKTMEANIEKAHVNYPALETSIRNLFKNGNPGKALDLSEEYTNILPPDITPEPDHPSLGLYALLFTVGLAIGVVSCFFIFKIGEKDRDNRIQKLEKLPEKVAQTTEKIRNMETEVVATNEKRKLKHIREDLEEAESEIKRALKR